MKFQPTFTVKKQFKTIYQKEFKDPQVQKPKFSLRQTSLTGNIGKLNEYRFSNSEIDGLKGIKIILALTWVQWFSKKQ